MSMILFWLGFQVPAKPNYSLVLYYAADRPVNKDSLLGKFIDGTDSFRDSRFKLIPSIREVLITLSGADFFLYTLFANSF